jgi:hypothetical protein
VSARVASLPCPFCKGLDLNRTAAFIECLTCGARGPLAAQAVADQQRQARHWNTRAWRPKEATRSPRRWVR